MAEGGRQEGSTGYRVGAQVPMATPSPIRGPEATRPGKGAPPGEAEAEQETWTLGEAKPHRYWGVSLQHPEFGKWLVM